MNQGIDLLLSQEFKTAVVSISKRAERQIDTTKLEDIFVETDMFARFSTREHQLILGRRGTGKTHMMKVFGTKQRELGNTVIEMDCTNLGSGIGNYEGIGPETIAAKFFVAFLNHIGTELLEHVAAMESPDEDVQENLFNKLAALSDFFVSSRTEDSPTFNYRQICDSLTQIIDGLGISTLYVLIDEWAQVPYKAQPYLAELIKRSLFTVRSIALKIMAVNFQCVFFANVNGEPLGLQRGADITDMIEIDDYFVYDENPQLVREVFGQILYNHIGAEVSWDLRIPKDHKNRMVVDLFTQASSFDELVRASEGNARDFLCIFSRAYFSGFLQSDKSNRISIPNIERAAHEWFEAEKMSNIKLEPRLQPALGHIFDRVIRGYKSRTFMIREEKADHGVILRLLNERILHKLRTVYSSRSEPGIRYNLFTLDFGAYIRFKGTENEPDKDFFIDNRAIDYSDVHAISSFVPIDDKRSIRNIILDPEAL